MKRIVTLKEAEQLFSDYSFIDLYLNKCFTTCEDCKYCNIYFGDHYGYIKCVKKKTYIFEEFLHPCCNFKFK